MEDPTLELKEDILIFLDQTCQLKSICQSCRVKLCQSEWKGEVSMVKVNVDVLHLSEISSSLTNLVLHEPDRAQQLFQEVVYTTLQTLLNLPESCSLAQIQVQLQVFNLPSLPDYKLSVRQFLMCNFESRFYTFEGLACARSTTQKYSKSTKYVCLSKQCKGSKEDAFIRLFNRGSAESQVIRCDFRCIYCGCFLKEDIHRRVLGEKLIVEMVSVEDISNRCPVKINQCIRVIFRDELTSSVEIGSRYSVVGVPVADFMKEGTVRVVLEASSVCPLFDVPRDSCLRSHWIPESILYLRHGLTNSPWSFSARLACMFASEISPPGTFYFLKMCMLLSLMQTGSSNKGGKSKLDLLATGDEDVIIGRLLHFGELISGTLLNHNSKPLFPSTREVQQGLIIDGGSILLSGACICCIGNLNLKRKEVQEKIMKVLQERCIAVELSKKEGTNKIFEEFPVYSTLWAYQKSKDTRKDASSKDYPFKLCVNCDNQAFSSDEFLQQQLCHSLLSNCLSLEAGLLVARSISFEDLQQFIWMSASRIVKFSSDAETLLKEYFVTSRRMYEGDVKERNFPLTTLETLSTLAVSHAKLSLHHTVTQEDAVIAIHIFEECMSGRFAGHSFISMLPQAHIKTDKLSHFIDGELNEYMSTFHKQLLKFCRIRMDGDSHFLPED
ncbi:Minichromosome maintenance domain-containing protein 2 [Holothuria leucospilota]|uniref:Minichromosome maintenance domain-containing protein 2 n=1 Tax=Holothuria leucospilota TaxID=206669 RepID=A0A9Q1BJE2_HOLLE|nr:Minichromosome maintenance domain-containing protein 2 [Holothuria leucospilota]